MSIEDEIFLKYSPNFEKLKKYGFKLFGRTYMTKEMFFDNDFMAEISVSSDGRIKGKVNDTENGEIYLPLRIKNQEGAFTGKVREAYVQLLTTIREKCFDKNYFVTSQANRIASLIYQKYGDNPVFMWEDYPTFGIYKNAETNKWYGLIMYISRTKLAENSEQFVEIINLKLDKDKIQELLKKDGFYPAYHMNKKLWITIALDGTISDSDILKYIYESYSYTVKKSKNKKFNKK